MEDGDAGGEIDENDKQSEITLLKPILARFHPFTKIYRKEHTIEK